MTEDLFATTLPKTAPLAARLRPARREDFAGQEHLLKRLPRRHLHSMLLYGPPGCGKTTLATILAEEAGYPLFHLSAISTGVKEVRQVIERGRQDQLNRGRGVALFLDEIHRFSRSQQDSLLQAVELGSLLLIGATTENPSFSINNALLSRLEVYRLLPLEKEYLRKILQRAIKEDRELSGCALTEEAQELLLTAAGGDGRRLLSILELAWQSALQNRGGAASAGDGNRIDKRIDKVMIAVAAEGRARRYDRAGEGHYDHISAFIKSIRGSDPDAALLYLSSMLEGGEDPLFIARRLIILAAEDIGNAAPEALTLATSAYLALERIGLPEGRIVLSQATLFLAAAPKSNSAYLAIDRALAFSRGVEIAIPDHLRNAPTATHRQEGAGEGYLYPHDFRDHFIAQSYFPAELKRGEGAADPPANPPCFYSPTSQGEEEAMRRRLKKLWPDRYVD